MMNKGDEMYIETKRLILRDLIEQDTEALFEMKNDEQVMKHPFFQGDVSIDFIKIMLAFFQSVKDKGLIIDDQHPERGNLFAICLKYSGDVIGVISVHPSKISYEVHMGWYMKSLYTKMGYASEAGAAASDYLLEALSLEYITASVALDNPASFRTAQKSGFRLFEKGAGDYYHDNVCNVEDFNVVGESFTKKQNEIGSYGYHFRKFKKNSKTKSQFYDDTVDEGRFS
ncbi:GNAT family N-acetyltransferase [Paenibacillus sp. FSL K6-3166]|uniref:GNAT family N-acetyltransferase n=2 Tax=unclassified Paenibacillus TaxID=185978 RepID=UPI000BA0A095|nr:hypothetical protein CA598_00235 [Paenibacillus sp. VTT E-133291]